MFHYSGYTQDPGEIFFRDDVQLLLEKLTGCNYEKLFKPRKLGNKLSPPKYELLTQEELDKLMAEANQKAKLKLKMPPLLKERKPIEEVFARNPELQGYDTAKYVFTDISYGLSEKVRPEFTIQVENLCSYWPLGRRSTYMRFVLVAI